MIVISKIKRIIINKIFHYISCLFACIFPMKDNKVCFLSDVRDVMGGNLAFIYDSLDEKYEKIIRFKPYRGYRLSFKQNLKRIYDLETSHYIILDDFSKSVSLMKVRKNQEVCQLWHGPGAFKKFGYSRLDKEYKKKDPNGHMNYTKAFVTSEEIRDCYAEGFGMDKNNVLALGMPRTDMFFDLDFITQKKKELYQRYPEFVGKKVIMFAPTYRGVTLNEATYDFDQLDFNKLYNQLGDDYVFCIKWHPGLYKVIKEKNIEVFDKNKYENFIFDLSEYRDINDLLLITDVLITDYSSVVFDYLLIDKPIIYYTYDLEQYVQDRGLYFDFYDYVYGNVALDIDALIEAIREENMDLENRRKFKIRFMSACDGRCTSKIMNNIFDN